MWQDVHRSGVPYGAFGEWAPALPFSWWVLVDTHTSQSRLGSRDQTRCGKEWARLEGLHHHWSYLWLLSRGFYKVLSNAVSQYRGGTPQWGKAWTFYGDCWWSPLETQFLYMPFSSQTQVHDGFGDCECSPSHVVQWGPPPLTSCELAPQAFYIGPVRWHHPRLQFQLLSRLLYRAHGERYGLLSNKSLREAFRDMRRGLIFEVCYYCTTLPSILFTSFLSRESMLSLHHLFLMIGDSLFSLLV